MKMKKFTAPSMKEALRLVKEELGSDAIILNTRSKKAGGVVGFMKHTQYEVTAAYDDKPGVKTSIAAETPEAARAATPVTYSPIRQARPTAAQMVGETKVKDIPARVDIENVFEDIKELKRSFQKLVELSSTGSMEGLPRHLADLLRQLTSWGFDEKIAKGVTRQLLNELAGAEINDRAIINRRATEHLVSLMGDIRPISLGGPRPIVVAFVGPTGSGKTTTIAKLATDLSLTKHKKVSVMTIDTKRIDAVGQLKSYCRIIDIPLHIAYNPDELPSIMPKLMDSDIVLFDTPGSGPMDRDQMADMEAFLSHIMPNEVHLTMSVTTSQHEMHRIQKNFGALKPNRVIFTKLDETNSYGPMFSFAIASKMTMSYVTFGQNVPGDMALANPTFLMKKCFSKLVGSFE